MNAGTDGDAVVVDDEVARRGADERGRRCASRRRRSRRPMRRGHHRRDTDSTSGATSVFIGSASASARVSAGERVCVPVAHGCRSAPAAAAGAPSPPAAGGTAGESAAGTAAPAARAATGARHGEGVAAELADLALHAALDPVPTATRMMTAATPMRMPSVVSASAACWRDAATANRSVSRGSPGDSPSSVTAAPAAASLTAALRSSAMTAVAHADDPLGVRGDLVLVGDHHERCGPRR